MERSVHRHQLDFWYDFASPYAYLAAMRIEALAETHAVDVRWRPFLLGPIFAAQGWTDSPFNLFPAKGRYHWRDLARQSAKYGLPFKAPANFPPNSLAAVRIGLHLRDNDQVGPFSRALFAATFGEGRTMSDADVLASVLTGLGIDAGRAIAESQSPGVKARLRAETEEARSRGLFGSPTFLTGDGELFWGNDRLEEAIAWAAGERPGDMR